MVIDIYMSTAPIWAMFQHNLGTRDVQLLNPRPRRLLQIERVSLVSSMRGPRIVRVPHDAIEAKIYMQREKEFRRK